MSKSWKTALSIGGLVGLSALIVAMIWAMSGPSKTHDQAILKLVNGEAHVLMEGRTTKTKTDSKTGIEYGIGIPQSQWPPAVAGLKPRWVTVFSDGVDIRLDTVFDDHWGYFIPLDAHKPPVPANCFSPLGQGVYWYDPC